MFELASMPEKKSAESRPLLISGDTFQGQNQKGKLRKVILSIAVVFILILVFLTLIPTSVNQLPTKIGEQIKIPSFSGPRGTIHETVYHSHYISRVLGASSPQVSDIRTTRSIEAILKWMEDWIRTNEPNLSSSDAQTASGIYEIYKAYVSTRNQAGSTYFWPSLLQVFRLRELDIYEEISTDQDAETFTLEGHNELSEIVKEIRRPPMSLEIKPSRNTPLVNKLDELISGLDSADSGIAQVLEAYLGLVAGNVSEIIIQDITSTSLHVKAGFLGITVNSNCIKQPETHAHRFLNSFEVLRLSLPMKATDQLFARVVELLAVSWNNYLYLKPKAVQYIIEELKKTQELVGESTSWFNLAKDVWGHQ